MIPKPTTTKTASGFTLNPIVIIGALFFIFGFVTWLNSVLIPYLKLACELNNFESYLVAFAFYISYLVMAIPSSWVLKATGFKKGMAVGLVVMAVGALVFIPAAKTRTYELFLLGLFIQGTGLAILQTASNPYITILGAPESAAKRISIMGICNKVAGAIAPIALGTVALKDADGIKAKIASMTALDKATELNTLAERVILPYIIIVVVLIILAVLVYLSSLPEIDTDKEDEAVAAANTNKTSIMQFPHLLLGVLTVFIYVGVEVMAGDTIISYGASQGIALSTAKFFTTCTLVAMIVGYLIGIFCIPRYLSQEKAMKVFALIGVVFVLLALFTHGYASVLFIALLGLANSLMWPAIWPLALAGLGRFTKIGSSLLIMGIAGGAIIPLIYGRLADIVNPQQAYWIMVPCYLFIWYYAARGHKAK
ncbi:MULTISPECIES: sugar MFS transporter [Pedobacter]|jgi:FHS family L-fucose permease-like MFS transporter|uniref:sugar MFS transporter n=1 Tax=Pedobacter TaxID=84567 RepID=UPI00106233A5|nr:MULTISPECIES: sugar MFS transporter [Pedobacter]HWW41972.1 sugar MFS transporter [Pedobacter sp.]